MGPIPDKRQKMSNKKKYFKTPNKKFIEAGQRGFFATCNFREKECIRECYNVLNEYADVLYRQKEIITNSSDKNILESCHDGEPDVTDVADVTDALKKEIDAMKECKEKEVDKHLKFQSVATGANNCVFINTLVANPVELGEYIVEDIATKKEKKTRHLIRLVPIEIVCHATYDDIKKTGETLFEKYFKTGNTTFSISFNRRCNNAIKREQIIDDLAEIVAKLNPNNKVDLQNPAKTVIVEIIKGLCCLSVVSKYIEYKKYNLLEIAAVDPTTTSEEKVQNDEISKDKETS